MRDWIKVNQMGPEEIEAAALVQLFFLTTKDTFARLKVGEVFHFTDKDLHLNFPIFAKSLGLFGPIYENVNGKCPAVSMCLENDESLLFFIPRNINPETQKILNEREDGEKIRKEVLEFCKVLRPNWNWSEI
jgi:hypothetical protein